METSNPVYTFLELGQLIKIIAPANEDLNDKKYFIEYLDENKFVGVSNIDYKKKTFKIVDGCLSEESITQIVILYTPKKKGFCLQNGLEKDQYISIHFDTVPPITINGKITNLEEDMIEVSFKNAMKPDTEDKLYIDFAYKGIPEHLNIFSITIIDKIDDTKMEDMEDMQQGEIDEDLKQQIDMEDMEYVEEDITKLFDQGEILIGDVVTIQQYEDIAESERIYDINMQTSDMLDELLSDVDRTNIPRKKLREVDLLIRRYKELRQNFSIFDSYGNINGYIRKGAMHKPLINKITSGNHDIKWMVPVVLNKKVLNDIETPDEDLEQDIFKDDTEKMLDEINEQFKSYKQNIVQSESMNKYIQLYKNINENITASFLKPKNVKNVIAHISSNNKIETVINNLGDFSSSTYSNKDKKLNNTTDFSNQITNRGQTIITKIDRDKYSTKELTKNDEQFVIGLIKLPLIYARYSTQYLMNTKLYTKALLHENKLTYDVYKTQPIVYNELTEKTLEGDTIKNFSKNKIQYYYYYNQNLTINDIDLNDTTKYDSFLDKIVPKTKSIFNLIKDTIPNPHNYKNIIDQLEPYGVYNDDISFKQYLNIQMFIKDVIRKTIENITSKNIENSKLEEKLRKLAFNKEGSKSILFDLFDIDNEKIRGLNSERYNLNSELSMEYLTKVYQQDNGKLFNSILTLLNSDLYQPININKRAKDLVKETMKEQRMLIDSETKKDNCDNQDDPLSDPTCIPNIANKNMCDSGGSKACNPNEETDTFQSSNVLKAKSRNEFMKEALDIFEEDLQKKIDELKINTTKNINKNIENLLLLQIFNKHDKYKYNTQKKKLAGTVDEDKEDTCPYTGIRDKILGINYDLSKKYNLIIDFYNEYCRDFYLNTDETKYWAYCRETNKPLLPMFLVHLSEAFMTGDFNIYNNKLNEICVEQGSIDDSGDKVVDKYTGYYIKNIVFDTDEGFDENDRKVVSREVLEKGKNKSLESVIEIDVRKINLSELNEKLTNKTKEMIELMDKKMSVNTDNHHGIIIELMNDSSFKIRSKEDYEKTGKKIPYDDYYNQVFIFRFIACYVIGLQSSIPDVVPTINYPGCKPSLDGYPILNDKNNLSAIEYIICILVSLEPWNGLFNIRKGRKYAAVNKKKILKIITHVVSQIDKAVILPFVSDTLQRKRNYLKTVKRDKVMTELNYTEWKSFLPYLKKIDVENPKTIVGNNGVNNINDYNLHMGKSIQFTFALQKVLEDITQKKELLIMSKNNSIRAANACCLDEINSYSYFAKQNKLVGYYNDIVTSYSKEIKKYKKEGMANQFMSKQNTKLMSIKTNENFNEEEIYQSFIKLCKFNTGINLTPEMKEICTDNKSSFNKNDSLIDKINTMKKEGYNYNNKTLRRLLKVVHGDNHKGYLKKYEKQGFIELFRENVDKLLAVQKTDRFLLETLLKLCDSYSEKEFITKETDKYLNEAIGSIKNQKNYLYGKLIEVYNNNVSDKKKRAIFKKVMKTYNTFKEREKTVNFYTGLDSTVSNKLSFYKKLFYNLCVVYPTMIINKQSFKKDILTIPTHWNLSLIHQGNVKKYIYEDFEYIEKVFNIHTKYISNLVKNDCSFVVDLFDKLTFVLEKQSMEQLNIFPIFNSKLINEICDYCFLFCISKYLDVERVIMFTNVMFDTEDDIDNESMFPELEKDDGEEKEKEDKYVSKQQFNKIIEDESSLERKELYKEYYEVNSGKVDNIMMSSLVNIQTKEGIRELINKKLEDEKTMKLQKEEESMKMDYIKPEDEQDDDIPIEGNAILNEERQKTINKDELKKYSTKLINILLRIISNQKKIANKTQEEIRFNVSRHVKAEKDKITKDFENMEEEDRDIEKMMKNLRLGKWSVGLTKSLFKYDSDVYDKLRQENLEGGFADEDYIEETMNELYAYESQEVNTLAQLREDGEEGEDGNADY